MKKTWMIYGANGYSAKLVAKGALSKGLRPILAGRNEPAVSAIADELKLPYRTFSLTTDAIAENLQDIDVVVNAAGPFSRTALPMIQGCIDAGAHYVDITGEVRVFEAAQDFHPLAEERGVVVCPGVGFDVIPTDCVAARLQHELPDATTLALGFQGSQKLSPGTAKTMVEGLIEGMMVRREGKLKTVGRGFEMRRIDFGRGESQAGVVPWGDLASAYWTTGIGNISVYTPTTGGATSSLMFDLARPLLGAGPVQKCLKQVIEAKVTGPDEDSRRNSKTFVWGEVRNAGGIIVEARVTTAHGYDVTMHGVLAAASHLLAYSGDGGYFTPSQLMGADLIEKLPGSSEISIGQRKI